MKAAALDMQKAVYTLLVADATLVALLAKDVRGAGTGPGIFDEVPENQPYPYIEIGEFTSREFRTLTRSGEELTMTNHIWSQAPGNKQALEILKEMNRLLGDVTGIAVTDHLFIASWFEFYDILKDKEEGGDLFTRHIPARYRIKIQDDTAFS